MSSGTTIEYSKGAGRLTADSISYKNGVIIAESSGNKGVVFQTQRHARASRAHRVGHSWSNLCARRERVLVERQSIVVMSSLWRRLRMEDRNLGIRGVFKPSSETLRGQNFQYDFGKKIGSLRQSRTRRCPVFRFQRRN